MRDFSDLGQVPRAAGMYCLLGREGRGTYDAYVGISNNIRSRLEQHLIRKDSSISTGVSAASLQPDHVVGVVWWIGEIFDNEAQREAAELIAFETLQPTLRSRGRVRAAARSFLEEPAFRVQIEEVISSRDSIIMFPSIADLRREVEDLRKIISALKNQIS